MKRTATCTLFALVAGCDPDPSTSAEFRKDCPPPEEPGTTTTTTAGEEPPPPPPPTIGVPTPTAPCPTIVDGDVTFCPGSMMSCRDALVVNASGSSGSGPLALHWHGTYESPEAVLAWDSAAQAIQGMVQQNGGLMVLPRADPAAVARPDAPFPWWVVCGESSPSQCNRPDDFILADEIVACAVEQGLVDPARLTTSGMSAGGIMTAHLVDRVGYLAGAVSWSGGLQDDYQPTTPLGDTAVLSLHGGALDGYCGAGMPPGQCYGFKAPAEAFALDVATAGDFAFVCDHQAGHSTAMGGHGAAFLRDAHTSGHGWVGYPFGYPGTGSDWMLNHYCYVPGTPSPWE